MLSRMSERMKTWIEVDFTSQRILLTLAVHFQRTICRMKILKTFIFSKLFHFRLWSSVFKYAYWSRKPRKWTMARNIPDNHVFNVHGILLWFGIDHSYLRGPLELTRNLNFYSRTTFSTSRHGILYRSSEVLKYL